MTPFHFISTWALRALLVGLALEGALSLYDGVSQETAKWDAIAGRQEKLAELRRTAQKAHLALDKRRLELAGLATPLPMTSAAFALDPAHAVEQALRREVMAGGGDGVTVKAAVDTKLSGVGPISCDIAWTEPRETAGHALEDLAARHPQLALTSLTMTLGSDQRVQSTLHIRFFARPQPGAPA